MRVLENQAQYTSGWIHVLQYIDSTLSREQPGNDWWPLRFRVKGYGGNYYWERVAETEKTIQGIASFPGQLDRRFRARMREHSGSRE